MIRFLKNWTLPIAMLVGSIGYPYISKLSFMMPYFIFAMLFLTFCKVSFKELRFEPLHWWLLAIQFAGSVLVFIALYPLDKYIAESAMLCIIAPTAAAAAVVTGKLGGSVPCLTMYTLLSSVLTAVMVPLFFPIVAELPPDIDIHVNSHFFLSVFVILKRVFPIIILPLLLAWFFRKFWPRAHRELAKISGASFYIWGLSLTVVTSVTVESLVSSNSNAMTEIMAAVAGLVTCAVQFYLGKRIGTHYGQRISGGQGLGQKNTVLVIWISQTYLNPTSSLGPCSYVIWQNIVNSYQLWKKRKKDAKSKQQ
jgi:BASS family bile acid:Na+ symporter